MEVAKLDNTSETPSRKQNIYCTYSGCKRRSSFGYLQESKKLRCREHKLSGMVNLVNGGCLLCSMNFNHNKLCHSCSEYDSITLAEKFVIQYIKVYYKKLLSNDSFKILLCMNPNSELDYDPYKKLEFLEAEFGTYRVVLIIINFNMDPYMHENKLIPKMIYKLGNDLRVIKDKIHQIHYSMMGYIPPDITSRVFYI